MSTLKGKVKWFNGTKGYGFIEREDKEKDVFVHSSAVKEAGLNYLNEGDELTFEVENGDKGPSAVKLQKLKSYFLNQNLSGLNFSNIVLSR
tara:strand:+ start:469 stop:741 length:273 start_codon:yes stop_codon:yes gene_type:complete